MPPRRRPPPGAGSENKPRCGAILGAVGSTLWPEREEQLDAVTAVSGSGPAYVFYFIEALQQAAQELGFAPAAARALALGTFSGAVKLAAGASAASRLHLQGRHHRARDC